jgi:hypothetical protein
LGAVYVHVGEECAIRLVHVVVAFHESILVRGHHIGEDEWDAPRMIIDKYSIGIDLTGSETSSEELGEETFDNSQLGARKSMC